MRRSCRWGLSLKLQLSIEILDGKCMGMGLEPLPLCTHVQGRRATSSTLSLSRILGLKNYASFARNSKTGRNRLVSFIVVADFLEYRYEYRHRYRYKYAKEQGQPFWFTTFTVLDGWENATPTPTPLLQRRGRGPESRAELNRVFLAFSSGAEQTPWKLGSVYPAGRQFTRRRCVSSFDSRLSAHSSQLNS
uniref:HDC18328 n=1 Tax=Drosophila melanogaster TaxID=7227 RepID=Q6IIG2_DROME|nr:TPA_inf: HDC18328 [Drosophila melanogaster]